MTDPDVTTPMLIEGQSVDALHVGEYPTINPAAEELVGTLADDSLFGLSGAVRSEDHYRSGAFAGRPRTGTMSVNGGIRYSADAPFGGYRQSGVGGEMGMAGFEDYLQAKTVAEPT